MIAILLVVVASTYIYNERLARAQHDATDSTTSLIVPALSTSDHYLGNKKAPIQLIVYSDLSCPYCKQFLTNTWPNIQKRYGNQVAVVFRNMPLVAIHPRAFLEAEAAECVARLAGEDAYWKFVYADYAQPGFEAGLSDAALTNLAVAAGAKEAPFSACLAGGEMGTRVQAEYTQAAVAGIADYSPSTVAKSAKRAVIVRGSYYPRFQSAIDYLLSVDASQ